ncbi:hypothetical protein [Methylotetracoccus oryzae]|uniref:hypothetical protein n=1 Tax=Methylotetracoccus oryzae TaxID=1919059 RepID=UPI001118C787|nr:hypothetical protein [Methylotetracoccus oryzae]
MNTSTKIRHAQSVSSALVRHPTQEYAAAVSVKLLTILAIVMMLCVPTAARAADVRTGPRVYQSTLTGEIMSAAVEVPAGGSAAFFTTPSTGYFVLMETWGPVVGSSFALSSGGLFSPGLALPQNEVLTCTAVDWDWSVSCMITGVYQK